ncbi:hypothetical protein A2U01_0052605, partial [Trifolium medium]|nr:hypothetical protein [Trifolium medium]
TVNSPRESAAASTNTGQQPSSPNCHHAPPPSTEPPHATNLSPPSCWTSSLRRLKLRQTSMFLSVQSLSLSHA